MIELRAGDLTAAWAPAGEAFVAWEPMTAPTNALVSARRGLRHVAPGETFAATFTVSVRDRPAGSAT